MKGEKKKEINGEERNIPYLTNDYYFLHDKEKIQAVLGNVKKIGTL